MNEINLPYASITYKDPILFFVYKENIELGFPEIRELITCSEKLSGYKPYVTFADVRGNANVTNEGKKILEDFNNMPLFRGTAVLVKNNLYKFAANFLHHYNNRKYPFCAFTSRDKAIKWLLSLPLE